MRNQSAPPLPLAGEVGSRSEPGEGAAPSLLDADEPDPTLVLRADGRSDFLLTADHAGRTIPRRLGTLGLPPAELDRHIAWDIGIQRVTELLSAALDATAVLQAYSRLVIDCNRPPTVAGSIPMVSETTEIPGNRGLTDAQRQARRQEIFEPYHARIDAVLEARRAAHRRTLLIAMHSYTPVFKGESRPMHVAAMYNRDRRLANVLLDLLRAEAELIVGDNVPYHVSDVTDYGIPVHAERRFLPHALVEIRQDLIADAAGQAGWADRFARLLPIVDARLRQIGA